MGLGSNEDVAAHDVDGGGGNSFGAASVPCSICLDVVADNADRSWAKLQCGHQFHLDCIGSAFNVKGAMQCPNCRKIEKGQWLYANGCRSFPEFGMEDWTHDEDLYDLSYSEMSFGVHWCPFGQLARLPSSFEEGEFSSSAYHELLGQHAIFAEHTPVSPASHPCPYIAYLGPIHPSSSNSSATVSDSSSLHNPWNVPSVPSEAPNYGFPGMDLHYNSWEHQHHSSPFSTAGSRFGGIEQHSVPPVAQRSARSNSSIPSSGSSMHPFLVGHSSGGRPENSVAPSMIPPYPGSNARARDRVQALQAYYQQQQPSSSPAMRTQLISSSRRSNSQRGEAQSEPVASSSDQNRGFYFFPSSRNFQEAENHLQNRFHSPSFSMNQVERDMGWGAFHQAAGGSDVGIRSSNIRQRQGSERTSTQHYRS